MRWKWLTFSGLLAVSAVAGAQGGRLDDRLLRRSEVLHSRWNALYPRQTTAQNAGNMGTFSAGVGWVYGRRQQWETQLLLGFLPKHQSTHAKLTATLKENYIPWRIPVGTSLEYGPLRCGLYLNAIFGSEFWRSQPARYPDRYYEFMSTKFRLNVFVGQQLSWNPPLEAVDRVTAFCEVSTCDLYFRAWAVDSRVRLRDILGLSLGLSVLFN